METRKVQKSGNSSFVVSLPSEWVKSQGIRKNAPVSVGINADGSLTILPNGEHAIDEKAEFSFRIGGGHSSVMLRTMVSAYIAGYSSIRLLPGPGGLAQAHSLSSQFTSMAVGQEVVEESEGGVVIKDILRPSEFPAPKILRRMHSISWSLLQMAQGRLRGEKNPDAAIGQLEREVDRLWWLYARKHHLFMRFPHLASQEGISLSRSHLNFLTGRAIERISDHALLMASVAGKLPKKERNALHKAAQESFSIYRRSAEAFFALDAKSAHGIIEEVLAGQKAAGPAMFARNSAQGATVAYGIRRIAEYSAGICENLIDFLAAKD